MPSWLNEFLLGPNFQIGKAIWEGCMSVVQALLGLTPMQVSNGSAWDQVVSNIYPVFLSIGISLMNAFFMMGFFKETADLQHNVTMEKIVMLFIRIIIADFLVANAVNLIRELFLMAGGISWAAGMSFDLPSIPTPDTISMGAIMLYWTFGLFFVIAAIVCGFVIIFTIYKRFLNLFLLVVFAPIALSTFAGDRGLSQSGTAWVKSFLGSCFEIVVISLALVIAGSMLTGGDIVFTFLEGGAADKFMQPIEALLTMVITTGAVKGAEGLFRKSFGL